MSDPTEHPEDKAFKKAAKAASKSEKKVAKIASKEARRAEGQACSTDRVAGAQPPAPAASHPDGVLSPAERSAAAAEQQVKLHRRRMWISLIGVLVALLTLVLGWLSLQ